MAFGFSSLTLPRLADVINRTASAMTSLVPTLGEETNRQVGSASVSGVGGFPVSMLNPGLTQLPLNFTSYREIRGNPVIAMARLAANAPVKSAEMALAKTDAADDIMLGYIKANLTPLWKAILRDAVRSRDFGYFAFEKVWTIKDGDYFIESLKPLLNEATVALQQDSTGQFVGAMNYQTILSVDKVLWFTYDSEAGNLYGRSWYEGELRRTIIPAWNSTLQKMVKYMTKVAGVIPMIEYPDGITEDESGKKLDTFTMAQKVLATLARGDGVVMPNVLAKWAEEAIERGIDIDKLKAWNISFVEPKGQHGADFDTAMRRMDTYIVRGLLIPERAVMEGQYGTKAEAGVHTDMVFMAAQEFIEDTIVPAINQQIIDQLLIAKYGIQAKGAVYLDPSPLINAKRAYMQDLLKTVLSAPANLPLLMKTVSLDAMLDTAGLPKTEDQINNEDIEDQLNQEAADKAAQAQAAFGGGPGTGGGDEPDGDEEEDDNEDSPEADGGKKMSLRRFLYNENHDGKTGEFTSGSGGGGGDGGGKSSAAPAHPEHATDEEMKDGITASWQKQASKLSNKKLTDLAKRQATMYAGQSSKTSRIASRVVHEEMQKRGLKLAIVVQRSVPATSLYASLRRSLNRVLAGGA